LWLEEYAGEADGGSIITELDMLTACRHEQNKAIRLFMIAGWLPDEQSRMNQAL
jgi:hypothetical protein